MNCGSREAWQPLACPQKAFRTKPPADRFTRIDFEYDSLGNLTRALAKMDGSPTGAVVTDNVYDYDDFGNLLLERQEHGNNAGANSPTIDYAWGFSAALTSPGPGHGNNFNRLASMTYPAREPEGERRAITLDYGNNTDDLDSQLGRITRIADASPQHALGVLAVYAYAGQSRRVETRYGGELGGATYAARQALRSPSGPGGGAPGYDRLDRFGRVKDLLYQNDAGATLLRALLGHDALDQRLFARITQAAAGGPHDNDRSHLYGYDNLRRLESAGNGRLTAGNAALEAAGPVPREVTWTFDVLGNWAGDPPEVPANPDPAPGRRITGPLNGEATSWWGRTWGR